MDYASMLLGNNRYVFLHSSANYLSSRAASVGQSEGWLGPPLPL